MANPFYSPLQLMEMDACTGCAACAEVCPAVRAASDDRLSGLHRLAWQRNACRARGGWLARALGRRRPSEAERREFAETVYRCTLCGACQEVCPAGLELRDLWLTMRQELGRGGDGPAKIDLISQNLRNSRNVFDEDQEDRAEWVEDMDQPPDCGFEKERAQAVYFTGCVASYFPLAQQIPVALAEVFQRAEVDFTLLGEEEWCCGFPLLGAGRLGEARELMEHNLDRVRAKGAREVVFACPSCYMMWRDYYPPEFKLSHASQFLAELLADGRLSLRELDLTVTYHDPCDLGRGAGVFAAPRRVIAHLPGVRLRELAHNREHCQCCGGGGNLEMIDPELNARIAGRKVDEVLAAGAEVVVSACQQCLRTMAGHARRNKIPLTVLDIAQLVRRALA